MTSRKVTNRKKNQRSGTQQVLQSSPRGSESILRGSLVAFLLLSAVAFLGFKLTSKQVVVETRGIVSAEHSQGSQPFVSSQRKENFGLPTKPRVFDTKAEQEQLLSRIEKLVAVYPQSSDAMHLAANTYSELLQTERAAVYFDRAIALGDRSPQVLVDYAGLLLQTGKQQAAVDLLAPTPAHARNAAVIDSLGNAYMQLGELDKAAEILQTGLQTAPLDQSIHLRLAQVQLQQQQFEEAEKNARTAIELGCTTNAAYTALSSALIRLGRREEALGIRSKTTPMNPQAETNDEQYKLSFQHFAAHTYGLLGGIHRANGQDAAAEEALMESVSIDPLAVPSLVALGDLFHSQRRVKQAIQVYQRLVDAQPENLYNYNNLASLGLAMGNVPLVEDALRRAVKADPTGNAKLRLADFLLRLGKSSEASTQAEEAVTQLGNADAYLIWISALKADGKMAAAMSALLRAREILPNDDRLTKIQL